MTRQIDTFKGPHQGQPVRTAGEPIERAQAAVLMVHGRGARAEDILSLADQLAQPGFAYLAPQAADNTWYPNRFLDPISSNEPGLYSALLIFILGELCSEKLCRVGIGADLENVASLGPASSLWRTSL